MRKQLFDGVRKTLCTLLVVLLLVSLTATSASAWYNKKGEIVAPPEKAKVETPKETKAASIPAPVTAPPVMATAPNAFGSCYGFDDCGRCCNEWKVSAITTVSACFTEGYGCFDRFLW